MSKYKTIDEIIDAYKGMPPRPKEISMSGGKWVGTDTGAYVWVYDKVEPEIPKEGPRIVPVTDEELEAVWGSIKTLIPGISKPNDTDGAD